MYDYRPLQVDWSLITSVACAEKEMISQVLCCKESVGCPRWKWNSGWRCQSCVLNSAFGGLFFSHKNCGFTAASWHKSLENVAFHWYLGDDYPNGGIVPLVFLLKWVEILLLPTHTCGRMNTFAHTTVGSCKVDRVPVKRLCRSQCHHQLHWFLGGGFTYFLFSPQKLGKWSNLTVAYFSDGLVEPPTRFYFRG